MIAGRRYLALASALFLAACATPYQPSSGSGGYSERAEGDGAYWVEFRGNAQSGQERVSDFTLLRAAELVLEDGMAFFVILEAEEALMAYSRQFDFSDGRSVPSRSAMDGGARTTPWTDTARRPQTRILARGFGSAQDAAGPVIDAAALAAFVRTKYGLD